MTEQERKKRIKILRAELKDLLSMPRSDWHEAIEAFLRLLILDYKGVTMNTEVEIGTEPPRTDFIILAKDENVVFKESIFKIFRKINIIEYKSPEDSLNRRVIYKICGYAYMLIGTAAHEVDIPDDQVTISIFRATKNPRLFSSLEKEGRLIKTDVPGIYHVTGFTGLPVQIVITSELEGAEYAACRALTTNASEADVQLVIDSAVSNNDEPKKGYYRILIYQIAAKNDELSSLIRRRLEMNKQPLLDIMKDDIDRIVDENVKQVKKEADDRLRKEKEEADDRLRREKEEADDRLRKEQEEADVRLKKTSASHIKKIMNTFGVPIERAMDILLIPQSEKELYTRLVQNM